MVEFTHIQDDKAQMVDISGKGNVVREAVAAGKIYLRPTTLAAIREGTVVKGNVLATARVAATLSVKNTPNLIPMCHSIPWKRGCMRIMWSCFVRPCRRSR